MMIDTLYGLVVAIIMKWGFPIISGAATPRFTAVTVLQVPVITGEGQLYTLKRMEMIL